MPSPCAPYVTSSVITGTSALLVLPLELATYLTTLPQSSSPSLWLSGVSIASHVNTVVWSLDSWQKWKLRCTVVERSSLAYNKVLLDSMWYLWLYEAGKPQRASKGLSVLTLDKAIFQGFPLSTASFGISGEGLGSSGKKNLSFLPLLPSLMALLTFAMFSFIFLHFLLTSQVHLTPSAFGARMYLGIGMVQAAERV